MDGPGGKLVFYATQPGCVASMVAVDFALTGINKDRHGQR
jgi:hypothetical protein